MTARVRGRRAVVWATAGSRRAGAVHAAEVRHLETGRAVAFWVRRLLCCLLRCAGGFGLPIRRLTGFPRTAIGGGLGVAMLGSAHQAVRERISSWLEAIAGALLLIHGPLFLRGRAAARRQTGE